MRLPTCALAALVLAASAAPVYAQHEHHGAPAATQGWSASLTGQAFLVLNLQERKFTDFHQFESANWMMGSLTRATPRSRLIMHAMASAEPWTMRRLGSAQVFQAGETLDGLPLRDYQHPHDLIMGLDARFEWQASSRTQWFAGAAVVGSPAFGPSPFMHRASAALQPTAPLVHHMLDSTHITPGVVTAGVDHRGARFEVSAFRGQEPDEDRLDIDLGRLDSAASRLSWTRGSWRAQASGAWVKNPEPLEPGNVIKTTVSLEFQRAHSDVAPGLAWTIAVGRNGRESHDEWGVILEMVRNLTPRLRAYGRAEMVDRFILVDFDHSATTHEERHLRSRIGALMIGMDRLVASYRGLQTALGADVTLHRTPANLSESYGSPVSVHVYLRVTR